LETTSTIPEQRPRRPRKIPLDSELYCPHSMRASAGDSECDHDFEPAPTVRQTDFAVWNCTRCGRAFKFEMWKSGPATRATRSAAGAATKGKALQRL
jgi:ribosomal protein L37AE/L43A